MIPLTPLKTDTFKYIIVNPLTMPHIVVNIEDKTRLDKLKVHPREPYENVVSKLLDLFDEVSANTPMTRIHPSPSTSTVALSQNAKDP